LIGCTFTNQMYPSTLAVTKVVDTATWGGSATPSSFNLLVTASPNGAPVTVASGAVTSFAPGTYAVTESGGPSGYVKTGDNCGSVTLISGDTKTCTTKFGDETHTITVGEPIPPQP
jgi:hypothetical protein